MKEANWTKAWLARARVTDDPVGDLIADMQEKLARALEELQGSVGLRALRKIIMDRCGLVLHSDGIVRPIGEAQPKIRSLQAAE